MNHMAETPAAVNGAEFSGLAAIVTGGGSGIGQATARLLAARGAQVGVLDLNPGDEFAGFKADVTDDASVRAAVEQAADRLGGIDILVNNAGIGAIGTVADNSDEEWHRVFDVNVVGMVRTARAALPFLRRSRHAAIVNTCSVAAIAGLPQRALYSATKGAVFSLTLAMRDPGRGIGSTAYPGTADTPWIGAARPGRRSTPSAACIFTYISRFCGGINVDKVNAE